MPPKYSICSICKASSFTEIYRLRFLHYNQSDATKCKKNKCLVFFAFQLLENRWTMARYSATEALRQLILCKFRKKEVDHPFVDNASRQGCWWSKTKTRDRSLLRYNAPKSDVDNKAYIYSCKRKINRWPIVLLFNMLDTAAIASFVIWICNNPGWNKSSKAIRRPQFIMSLRESS